MATNPKYPMEPERRPRPRPAPVYPSSPPRSFKWFSVGVLLLVAAVVIFLAVWLLTFGGGNQQQQRPHPGGSGNGTPSGTPSTLNTPPVPGIQPLRPPLYAWTR